jgi:hypothetical protein
VLLTTFALAGIAMGALYMASNITTLGVQFDRERDFRYAAEAALAVGKSRLNTDPLLLPDTGVVPLLRAEAIPDADGTTRGGITVNMWVGPTGMPSGQYGNFASVVAEARDARGSRFVRRLEVSQENFARFAYWSERESNIGGTTIYFNNNDVLFGPVWSNDVIHIGPGRATFNDDVGTAMTIDGKGYGTFKRAVLERQQPMKLPSAERLSRLAGYADAGALHFAAPTAGGASTVGLRLEFVALDLDKDGRLRSDDEGFVRAYRAAAATSPRYVRGDYTAENCGDWHREKLSGGWKFYPAVLHNDSLAKYSWFTTDVLKQSGAYTEAAASAHVAAARVSLDSLMRAVGGEAGAPEPSCFLGGDPHLVAIERDDPARWNANQREIGGDATTFTPNGTRGTWISWAKPASGGSRPVDKRLNSVAGRDDDEYLFPLRGLNTGAMGVTQADGTVGVSGTLRGRVTLYAKGGTVVLLDDLQYAGGVSGGGFAADDCLDILGIIADQDILVANNAFNTPQPQIPPAGTTIVPLDLDDGKFSLQAVMMARGSAFGVEEHDKGLFTGNNCEGTVVERGCLYLSGGIIQQARGAVGMGKSGGGATGFSKRYSYDRCALLRPPPYFPTTGRYLDNRYYEVDPVGFDATKLFAALRPAK